MLRKYKEDLWACVVASALAMVTAVCVDERAEHSQSADSLQQTVMPLSPELRATIKMQQDSHMHKSQQHTLREIMHEILSAARVSPRTSPLIMTRRQLTARGAWPITVST